MMFLRLDSLGVAVPDVTFQLKPRPAQRGQVAAVRVEGGGRSPDLGACRQIGRGLLLPDWEGSC